MCKVHIRLETRLLALPQPFQQMTEMKYLYYNNSYLQHSHCVGSVFARVGKNTVLNAANPISMNFIETHTPGTYVAHIFICTKPTCPTTNANYTTTLYVPKTKDRLRKDIRWWKFASAWPERIVLSLPVLSIVYLGIILSFLRGHTEYM